MAANPQGTLSPPPDKIPMYSDRGILNSEWRNWFQAIFLRVGKEIALTNVQLENIQQEDLEQIQDDLDLVEAAVSALGTLTTSHTSAILKLQSDVEAINLEPRA